MPKAGTASILNEGHARIRSLYAKTGCRKKDELVRLLEGEASTS